MRERESLLEAASPAQTSQSLHSEFSRRDQVKSPDSPMPRDQEDSDQREPLTSEPLSLLERRITSASTLSEELLRETTRLDTSPHQSRDWSPTRDSEESLWWRETRKTKLRPPRRLTPDTRSFSPNSSRKRRLLPRRPLILQPQHQLRLLQPKPPSQLPRRKRRRPLPQLRQLQPRSPKPSQPRRPRPRRVERNEQLSPILPLKCRWKQLDSFSLLSQFHITKVHFCSLTLRFWRLIV